MQRAEAEVRDVTMRVDQARQKRLAMSVDDRCRFRPRVAGVEDADDLAVVADEQAGEMLDLRRRARLNAVRIVDQRIGPGGRAEQRRSERDEEFAHRRGLALFACL